MIRNEITTLNGRNLEWLFSSVSRCVFSKIGAWMKSHKLNNCSQTTTGCVSSVSRDVLSQISGWDC